MPPSSLDDYTDLTTESEFPGWTSYTAHRPEQAAPCRLVVFTPEISANQDFRAAWRHDTELLRRLPHDGLPGLLDTGDRDGVVYFATETAAGLTLQDYLNAHQLSWDEIADLGWQAASVIQHLHNSGVVHGSIDDRSVRITEQLRISLLDPGVARWILAADEPAAAGNLSALYRDDLLSLGRLLNQLASAGSTDESTSSEIPEQWWSLISDLSDSSTDRFPVTAREVQGRLGAILLEDSGESMDVVADRTAPGRGDRSIVDELLDTPLHEEESSARAATDPGGRLPRAFWVLLAVIAAVLAITAVVLTNR